MDIQKLTEIIVANITKAKHVLDETKKAYETTPKNNDNRDRTKLPRDNPMYVEDYYRLEMRFMYPGTPCRTHCEKFYYPQKPEQLIYVNEIIDNSKLYNAYANAHNHCCKLRSSIMYLTGNSTFCNQLNLPETPMDIPREFSHFGRAIEISKREEEYGNGN